MELKIFDAHAHYDDEQFDGDREKIIGELKDGNIVGVLNCGSSMEGSRNSVELAKKHDIFYAAVGIHPEYADKFDNNTVIELKELVKNKKVNLKYLRLIRP